MNHLKFTNQIDHIDVTLTRCFSDNLNCWIGNTKNGSLIRSSLIDTETKANSLFTILKSFKRIVWSHLYSVETEWQDVIAEHQWLTKIKQSAESQIELAHLNVYTEHLFKHVDDPRAVKTHLKKINVIFKLMNVEAWTQYTYWLSKEIEKVLNSIILEAIEEYPLEANLKDFIHEIQSPLLLKNLNNIKEAILILESLEEIEHLDSPEIVELEKALVQWRSDLLEQMKSQNEKIDPMIQNIDLIEVDHPELHSFKQLLFLFKTLLTSELHLDLEGKSSLSWGNRLIIEQMINDKLNVTPVVNCHDGFERTSFAFSIRLALQMLKPYYDTDPFLNLVMNWDHWCRQSKKTEIPPEELFFLNKLREYTLFNLNNFSLPLVAHLSHKSKNVNQLEVNLNFLEFLPTQYCLYDTKTEQLTGLSKLGIQLVSPLIVNI